MPEIAIALLHGFVLDHVDTLALTSALLALAWVLGMVMRVAWGEGLAIGLLALTGGANSAYFLSRAWSVPTGRFGWLALALALAIALVLRVAIPARQHHAQPWPWAMPAAVLVLGSALWLTQIITPLPSAGLSSNQVWFPYYLEESFRQGHFLTYGELGFAPGFLASIYYGGDIVGLIALGGWFGAEALYPAYLAGSIAAGIAAFTILCWGLRTRPFVLAGFVLTALAVLRWGDWVRLVMGNVWGDTMTYLGGAATLYFLAAEDERRRALLGGVAASLFMVLSRNYALLFVAGIAAASAFVWYRRDGLRNLGPWFLLAGLGLALGGRDVMLLLSPPSVFYQPQSFGGSPRLDSLVNDMRNILSHPLHSALSMVWIVALVAALATPRRRPAIDAILLPLLLLVLPFGLSIATGYGGGLMMTKLYIVGLLVPIWYPWAMAPGVLPMVRPPSWRVVGTAAAVLAVGGAAVAAPRLARHPLFADPQAAVRQAFASYQDNNHELRLAEILRAAYGPALNTEIVKRPILYFHYEPGIGLRAFIGGDFIHDLDYWSDRVQAEAATSETLEELVRRLNYPLLFLSYHRDLNYGFARGPDTTWTKFQTAIEAIGENTPWIERQFHYRYSTLLIPRRPAQ